jgi:DNA adenine methylase
MKTFLKYSGNKSRYVKHLIPLIPEGYKAYIEPFIGSGALFLSIQPDKWIINDLNSDLYTIWTCLKNSPSYVIKYLNQIGNELYAIDGIDNKKDYLRNLGNNFNNVRSLYKRSAIFIILKALSFRSYTLATDTGYYFKGFDNNWNDDDIHYVFTKRFFTLLYDASRYMNSSNGNIKNADYKMVLKDAKKGDFVFLDPPYIEDHDYLFEYNNGQKIDNGFLKELLVEVKKLDNKSVKWIMTQSDTKDVRNIFKLYNIKTYKVYRPNRKIYTEELIISNY